MPDIHNRKEHEQSRKLLRNNSTSAEATLWNYLKGKQLGKKFRRQHSVGNYILDFYCASDRIAIELDGESHFSEEGIRYDEQRTKYLNELNIKVVRFENVRVFEDVQTVLREIQAVFHHPDSGRGRNRSLLRQEGKKIKPSVSSKRAEQTAFRQRIVLCSRHLQLMDQRKQIFI